MQPVGSFGVYGNLENADKRGEEGVVGEDDIVEVHMSGLIAIDEVAVSIVQGVEDEAGQVHGNEVEVHALNTTSYCAYLLRRKFSKIWP